MILGPKLLKELGLSKIKSDDVILKPILQKEEKYMDSSLKNLVRKHLNRKNEPLTLAFTLAKLAVSYANSCFYAVFKKLHLLFS